MTIERLNVAIGTSMETVATTNLIIELEIGNDRAATMESNNTRTNTIDNINIQNNVKINIEIFTEINTKIDNNLTKFHSITNDYKERNVET